MRNNNISLGLIFGAGIGLSLGILTDNLAIYLSMGAGAGLALGAGIDAFLKKGRKDCKVKKSNTN
ncbi:hypothetical protein N9W32_01415 [Flavobacteriaceae bacterium]|nr:hypothetical protein [Flavobacteriaceae bacterium]